MKKIILLISIAAIFVLAGFNNLALAETTCDIDYNECKITITIKIAFAGATDQQIQKWKNEIEDVWNGPNNFQTTGDCECELKFKVETMKITNAANINCDPPPAGYHCVMVTPWNNNNNNLPWFYKPDGNKKYVVAYMGYKSHSPSQGGASINGWWSDQSSRDDYKDAAHEAGHMMGLGDEYGNPNIMGQTSGPNAKPTQEQIDQVVKNVCGEGACPDYCCCGNGKVDEDKGEQCDPMAEDSKCEEGEYCCSICCQCHSQLCFPEDGEYATEGDCQRSCEGGQCLYNYQTGCWDCKKYETKITPTLTTTNALWLGFGVLLSILFIVSMVLRKVKLFLTGLGVLAVALVFYYSSDISKIFEKQFEGYPSPEPSMEYAGLKETVAIFEEAEEIEGEAEVPAAKEGPPAEEQPPAEEEPPVGEEPPAEEEPSTEEEPPIEEPPIEEETTTEPEVKKTACQIACEEAGFLNGECQLFELGVGSCEERGFFTPSFADEYCEPSDQPGIYNVCCCMPE
jgi:hypothetical protein